MQTIHVPSPSPALFDALHLVQQQHCPILLTTTELAPAVLIDLAEFKRYQQWQQQQRQATWQNVFDALAHFESGFKIERAEQVQQIREQIL